MFLKEKVLFLLGHVEFCRCTCLEERCTNNLERQADTSEFHVKLSQLE